MSKFYLQATGSKAYTNTEDAHVRICNHGTDEVELAEFHRDEVPSICAYLADEAGIPHWVMRQIFADDDGPEGTAPVASSLETP